MRSAHRVGADNEAADATAKLRASAALGQTQGAMVITAAGIGWAILGLSALGPVPLTTLFEVLALPAILLLAAITLQRAGNGLPETALPAAKRRLFGQAVAGEIAGGVLILVMAGTLRRPDMILPLLSVAVGLHFLPLARVYDRPLYLGTSVVLCAVGISAIASVPPHPTAQHLSDRRLVTGLGAAATLWGTALVMLIQSRAAMLPYLQIKR